MPPTTRAADWWLIATVLTALLIPAMGCDNGPSQTIDASDVALPRNVLFIVIDALRADHIGALGYERNTTPHLDRLAAESHVFTRAYSATSWTLPSVASYMTSVYPAVHGVRAPPNSDQFLALPDAFITLAESLKAQGLQTAAITSQPWISDKTGLTQGFDEARSVAHASLPDEARILAEELVEWVDGHRDAPFFLYTHFMGPHSPYDVPSEFSATFTGDLPVPEAVAEFHRLYEFENEAKAYQMAVKLARENGLTRADIEYLEAEYDEKLAFTDACLGYLFGELEARGVMEDTLIIVTADHGEAFYEHGTIFHGQHLHEELVRVPLFLRPPGGSAVPRRIDEVVELVDLYPTIHEALGLDIPQAVSGESLIPVVQGQPSDGVAFAEGFGFKVITSGWSSYHDYSDTLHLEGGAPLRELYDLSRDPLEQDNRALSPPTSSERHVRLVPRIWTEIADLKAQYRVRHDEVEMDQEMIDRLRSLGYLGGGS